ncbi:hypothetical protein EI546_11795 [Aequorivita sp. H23M31]|uniref:Uncharacterized protein n=1 Tax=Aequorivita ciconiae TaxID=2494375 RepID=A0A410G4Z5_9FLAO|nr:DUF6766 family protein [Aequorivita sp. H23M31]QAA82357.1 hypothetical protein EI546_11795 [Aequorivita sp. H23M31]
METKHSFLKKNGLSITLLFLWIIFLLAQFLTGFEVHNKELAENGVSAISLAHYFTSGHFIQATFENWESEFLQMALYVILTVKLYQVGSAESKSLDKKEKVDKDLKPTPDSPWPVRKGGWWLKIYSNSLSIAFFILFLLSFLFHFYGSLVSYNEGQIIKGEAPEEWQNYIFSSQFWFESFQNWQSEFLSVASIVILSIWLRQKGSTESKPVGAPHSQTGG